MDFRSVDTVKIKVTARLQLFLALVLGMCVGCGSGKTFVPVEGKVTLDNKPLADATVMFSSTRATDPGPFVGTTDSDGHYALGPMGNEGGGAAAGNYIVTITTVKSDPNALEDAPPPTQREIVPAMYRSGSFRREVPEGGTKEANFDMKSR